MIVTAQIPYLTEATTPSASIMPLIHEIDFGADGRYRSYNKQTKEIVKNSEAVGLSGTKNREPERLGLDCINQLVPIPIIAVDRAQQINPKQGPQHKLVREKLPAPIIRKSQSTVQTNAFFL